VRNLQPATRFFMICAWRRVTKSEQTAEAGLQRESHDQSSASARKARLAASDKGWRVF
jgi:hypothetical protein